MRTPIVLFLLSASAWTLAAQVHVVGTENTPAVLEVDVENAVQYRSDIGDPARRGADANMTTAAAPRAFTDVLFIGDIVAVNGKRAKGLWTSRQVLMNFSPTPQTGFAVADVTRGTFADCKWEFLDADGRFVGAIMDSGYFPHAVVGGVGAFYGARGQMSGGTPPVVRPIRVASMSEDPANRRVLGGGTSRIIFHLIPAARPAILGVYDENFQPISAANPARRGGYVIVRASGLGPAEPGTVPQTMPFPQNPIQTVNSPVEVMLGGRPAEVTNKVGWPGERDVYRVDVRIPETVEPGMANMVLSAAWIAGSAAHVPVR